MKKYLDLEKIYADIEKQIDEEDRDVLKGGLVGLQCFINLREGVDTKKYDPKYLSSLYAKHPGYFNLKVENYIVEM